MGWPVVIATNGYGIPVTESDSDFAIPAEITDNGYGTPVVLVDSGGMPVKGVGGGAGPSATSTLTMAQIATIDANRVYQRSTTTGGGQGKGQGTIPLTISGATAGTVYARIRDEDGSTILQEAYALADIANGQTTLNVTGADARLGWFYVDVLDSSGWQLGTTLVGMGRVVGFAGQSLMARMFGRQDGQTATYSSLGVTIDPNCQILGSYNEANAFMPTVATQAWAAPGDVGNSNGHNAVGIGEFLRMQIAMFGVNVGAFAHTQGGVALSTYIGVGSNWTRLLSYITRISGAFEAFFWGQGHTDATPGIPDKGYLTGLDLLYAQLDAQNSFPFEMYVWTLPNINNGSFGSPYQRNKIRKGAIDWCAANSATYVHMYDLEHIGDGVHESQAGSLTLARHMHRAARQEAGLSSGIGPAPVSASRSGTTITLTLSDVGQTNLVLAGTPENRVFVFSKNRVNRHASQSDNRFPVSSVSVTNATTLSIVLANDPGDGHELDLYLYWPSDGAGTPATDTIRDDRTDGDGITVGRNVQANAAPIQIAAPNPVGAVNAPPGGYVTATSPFNAVGSSTTFAAGASGFGNEMTGGTGLAGNNLCPVFSPGTIEGWFTCPTISGVQVLFGGWGSGFVSVTAAGKLSFSSTVGTVTGATTLVAGKRYHFAAQVGPSGVAVYLTNITDATAGVRDGNSGTAQKIAPSTARYSLRNHLGSFAVSGGALDEVAVFQSERYSGTSYTCPTAPFAGTETDLVALYHLDETSGATTLVESIAA